MKLETQRARWQAVLSGKVVDTGNKIYTMNAGQLLESADKGESWASSFENLRFVKTCKLYEPKPENKVIVIADNELADGIDGDYYKIDALSDTYDTENDAIRAAMAWLGEKAKQVKITPPQWFVLEDETYCSRLGRWGAIELKGIELALLMRWPIEVLEEV